MTREIATRHFSVTYPDTLEPVASDHAELVLAFREDDGQFRPNIVFTVEEHSAPVSDAAMRVLQLAPEIHRGVVFPSVDLWGSDGEARRITMLYPAEHATDVCVRQWVWATGTHHVHATASFLPFQWHWAEPTLEWVVQNIVLGETVSPQSLDTPTEFALDAELSAVTGVALERFDDLAPTPDRQGIPIAVSTIELLTRTVSQLRLGSRAYRLPKDARGGAEAQELERCGLAQGDTLGPFGESVATTLAQGTIIAEVQILMEGRTETFTATARGDEVVVVLTAGMGYPLAAGRAHLIVCGIEQVLRHLTQWIAVKPRHLQGETHEIALTQLQDRLKTSQCAGGWRRINVRVPEVSNFALVVTPEFGPLIVDDHDEAAGILRFQTYPPGQLFEELRESIFERMRRSAEGK